MFPMQKLAKNVKRNKLIFLWADFLFKLHYLLDALLPNELSDTRCIAMQTQIHRHKTLGMLSCHRKSTKIVLIRENMEQFICSNIRAAPPYGIPKKTCINPYQKEVIVIRIRKNLYQSFSVRTYINPYPKELIVILIRKNVY
jgi:hypothetical protein